MDNIQLSPASLDDLDAMMLLLDDMAGKNLILPRQRDDVAQRIRNFIVARRSDGAVVGTVALRPYEAGYYEVRSLVVSPAASGAGLGSRLVKALLEKAAAITPPPTSVFVLTRRPNLFRRLGFQPAHREQFPLKIWADCRLCPNQDNCDEVALELKAFPIDARK